MTSAYSSMDPGVVSSLQGQYDIHGTGGGRSMMLHSPSPHFTQQPQQQPVPSHRQSPSTPLNAAAYQGHHAASQLTGYGAPGPGSSGAAYMVAASTPGVSPGAVTPSSDAPAKRDRDSIYGFVFCVQSLQ